LDAQTILWFGLSGGALIFALSLIRQRYITRTPRAMQSRGAFTMFAVLMLIFSFGALLAGLASL
jgi:hypothetical protein